MKILIETPTWLGDTVMTTPAIENIVAKYPKAKITLFGSYVSITALKNHPNLENIIIDNSKNGGIRYLNLLIIAKSLKKFDIAISFRRTITSKLFLFFLKADKKISYKRYTKKPIHQVIRYNDFINNELVSVPSPLKLKLHYGHRFFLNPTLGLNAGASYGSAKRWYPAEFAKVAKELSHRYDIIIFGGKNELDISGDIEDKLKRYGVKNYQNLAGKTSVEGLINNIAGLSLFITNDSGPMHIASAFSIPTVAIFGPTKDTETNQWKNPNGVIIKKELDCSPCMKRVCPLKHHDCMKMITANDVLELIKKMDLK